jgi:hypothetical protein
LAPSASTTVEGSLARAAEAAVDRLGDAAGGGEVWVAQADAHHLQGGELEADLALDDGAARDLGRRRGALGDALALARGGEAADRHRTLRHRIDLAVRAHQRRDQQRAALQALGVAERADRHVDPRTMARARRQGSRHHHGGDVVGLHVGAADVDAQALQHSFQALASERRIAQRITGAGQADHQAVADQHVVAHALEVGDVLDARAGLGRGGAHDGEQGGNDRSNQAHGFLPDGS